MELRTIMLRIKADKPMRIVSYTDGTDIMRGTASEIMSSDFYEELFKHYTVHRIDADPDGTLVIGILDPENPEILDLEE